MFFSRQHHYWLSPLSPAFYCFPVFFLKPKRTCSWGQKFVLMEEEQSAESFQGPRKQKGRVSPSVASHLSAGRSGAGRPCRGMGTAALARSDELQERGGHDLSSWFQPLTTLACVGASADLSGAFTGGGVWGPVLCSHGGRLTRTAMSGLGELGGSWGRHAGLALMASALPRKQQPWPCK